MRKHVVSCTYRCVISRVVIQGTGKTHEVKTRSCCWGTSGVFERGPVASRQHGLEFVSQAFISWLKASSVCCVSVFSFRTHRAGITWEFAMRRALACRGVWHRLCDVTSSQRLWGTSLPGRGCRPSCPWRQQVQVQVKAHRAPPHKRREWQ